MKTLALRIYLTVVTVLLLFTLGTGWLAQRHMEHERNELQSQAASNERAAAWGELIENSLPPVNQPEADQAQALLEWAARLRLPLALDNPQGRRIATSDLMQERLLRQRGSLIRLQEIHLSDGRVLWILRPSLVARGRGGPPSAEGPPPPPPAGMAGPPHWSGGPLGWLAPPPWLLSGAPALILSLLLLFVAVAIGAWPVANRLTRRLKALRQGVETFGSGQLQHRVEVEGRDEVADLAQSFNQAAQRIEDLIGAHRNLLANASHELRSPLARLKMAVSMMAELPPERCEALRQEINQDIKELDALVEEVLLASRLDAKSELDRQPVDLVGLAAEEARRVGAVLEADEASGQAVKFDERLVRRAVRNLLENAKRYGGDREPILLNVSTGPLMVEISVSDRGPGVPPEECERIFEPFYRLPGHSEHAGGVGLGLSLVRQIAQRHGGQVRCEAREGGGSRFVITLPKQPAQWPDSPGQKP
ncbi:MAG: HAMP domain-containing sensor histidine kinase [Aquabacterium sp.]|uniref:sensor histidine kinase n=1 Tax=Aquabacterium sp. TaxID=1872578 RepID=UPI002715750F|nr:HAMP domain-containing sensor histidine kinase [Aquabacterium sp.]MDO9002657.1 HAMP domain-containing sensor histidine kinase [Aquabacterium sp.]